MKHRCVGLTQLLCIRRVKGSVLGQEAQFAEAVPTAMLPSKAATPRRLLTSIF